MVTDGVARSDWLNYLDRLDHDVYELLAPWWCLEEEEMNRYFSGVAPSLLANWRLYQILHGGRQRHIYTCLDLVVAADLGIFIRRGMLQQYHSQQIIGQIAEGFADEQIAGAILDAHIETALIVSQVHITKSAVLLGWDSRLAELEHALSLTSEAIRSDITRFRGNYACCAIYPLLTGAGSKIPHLLPVIETVVNAS